MNIKIFSITKKMVSYICLKHFRIRIISFISNESLKEMFRMTIQSQWQFANQNKYCFDLMTTCLSEKPSKCFNMKINNYFFKIAMNINNTVKFVELRFQDLFFRFFQKKKTND